MYALRTLARVFRPSLLWQVSLSVPFALQVGGYSCALAFTLLLEGAYLVLVTLKIGVHGTRIRLAGYLFDILQVLAVPVLLGYALNEDEYRIQGNWWLRTWDRMLARSTGLFGLMEGFSTVLVVQYIGQCSRQLIQTHSENWAIVFLMSSGGVITGALYLLWRVYAVPWELSDAMLGTVIVSLVIVISTYAILTSRASTLESSLMFAYIVYLACMASAGGAGDHSSQQQPLGGGGGDGARPEWPPVISLGVAKMGRSVGASVPRVIVSCVRFLMLAKRGLTNQQLVGLVYRSLVMATASWVLQSTNQGRRYTRFGKYGPCVWVAMVAQLVLVQPIGSGPPHLRHAEPIMRVLLAAMGGDVDVWRWLTASCVLALWCLELALNTSRSQ